LFNGSGTGPTSTKAKVSTLENPTVNLLPINNQLWLTTDTRFWGRMDPETLDTYPDEKVVSLSITLSSHPACDPSNEGACYVFYGCGDGMVTNLACISQLVTHETGGMGVSDVTNATLPVNETIMYSHSPGITQSSLIIKVDHFREREEREVDPDAGGILKTKIQAEDNLWLVVNRTDSTSRILTSDISFVNNHIWNPYDDEEVGGSVVDAVPATGHMLGHFFLDEQSSSTDWDQLFFPPKRCVVPFASNPNQTITCKNLLVDDTVVFDHPTYNPHFKTKKYQYVYAISPSDRATSLW